ncbi:hypothetical protein AB0C12_23910 [Actinoplanes sp. NPDC048967]|uniref:hypothetical protein n=1 Tax=Actinoplanes sp. NPDC048967 TaxID=3155269 RepID=UPI0033E09B6C
MSRLRRRCERRLENIAIPNPFDLDIFCAAMATYRGRPLTLRPMAGLSAGLPCGLWISVESADYVFYDPETSQLHAEHIVLHELSHMLSGHTTGVNASSDGKGSGGMGGGGNSGGIGRLVPDLDPRTINTILGRVSYTTTQEREAEMLASLIRARSAFGAANGRPSGDTLGRVADVLKFSS